MGCHLDQSYLSSYEIEKGGERSTLPVCSTSPCVSFGCKIFFKKFLIYIYILTVIPVTLTFDWASKNTQYTFDILWFFFITNWTQCADPESVFFLGGGRRLFKFAGGIWGIFFGNFVQCIFKEIGIYRGGGGAPSTFHAVDCVWAVMDLHHVHVYHTPYCTIMSC